MPDIRDQWSDAVLASDLPDNIARTCFAIRTYVDKNGRATMGIAALARKTGRSSRQIKRHLDQLARNGLLERIPGKGQLGPGGVTALTLLRIPAGRDTHDVPTSSKQSSDTQGVPTLNGKACHGNAQVGTSTPSSRDTQGVPRTNRTISEPGADAPASQGGPAAPGEERDVDAVVQRLLESGIHRDGIKFARTCIENGYPDETITNRGVLPPEAVARLRAAMERR